MWRVRTFVQTSASSCNVCPYLRANYHVTSMAADPPDTSGNSLLSPVANRLY